MIGPLENQLTGAVDSEGASAVPRSAIHGAVEVSEISQVISGVLSHGVKSGTTTGTFLTSPTGACRANVSSVAAGRQATKPSA